jgi:hypothetical protein
VATTNVIAQNSLTAPGLNNITRWVGRKCGVRVVVGWAKAGLWQGLCLMLARCPALPKDCFRAVPCCLPLALTLGLRLPAMICCIVQAGAAGDG